MYQYFLREGERDWTKINKAVKKLGSSSPRRLLLSLTPEDNKGPRNLPELMLQIRLELMSKSPSHSPTDTNAFEPPH